MKLKIISLTRHPEKTVESLEQEYLKRLSAMTRVELVNLKPKVTSRDRGKLLIEEEKLIQKVLSPDDILVALDVQGKEFSTQELAAFLEKQSSLGAKSLTFLIGGAEGISPSLLERASYRWSLSRLTFPHRLVRLLLIETLYRSLDFSRLGPYHKA
ncbi:MAG: 23S rRNA (pseudouridine(1915)-N(3))-methyltransferase RlmH [Candidatus Omnitrophica bacterium]|nr:23S rRNA (pseudouridine(1915)-N(3))-methyltransferase RlmH [Candidatus Omnitrophota bacterium]